MNMSSDKRFWDLNASVYDEDSSEHVHPYILNLVFTVRVDVKDSRTCAKDHIGRAIPNLIKTRAYLARSYM